MSFSFFSKPTGLKNILIQYNPLLSDQLDKIQLTITQLPDDKLKQKATDFLNEAFRLLDDDPRHVQTVIKYLTSTNEFLNSNYALKKYKNEARNAQYLNTLALYCLVLLEIIALVFFIASLCIIAPAMPLIALIVFSAGSTFLLSCALISTLFDCYTSHVLQPLGQKMTALVEEVESFQKPCEEYLIEEEITTEDSRNVISC